MFEAEVLERIDHRLGDLMSTIADLVAAVAANTQAVDGLQTHLAAGGTVLDAADQTALDGVVTSLGANTAALEAIVNPPAPLAAAVEAAPVA